MGLPFSPDREASFRCPWAFLGSINRRSSSDPCRTLVHPYHPPWKQNLKLFGIIIIIRKGNIYALKLNLRVLWFNTVFKLNIEILVQAFQNDKYIKFSNILKILIRALKIRFRLKCRFCYFNNFDIYIQWSIKKNV